MAEHRESAIRPLIRRVPRRRGVYLLGCSSKVREDLRSTDLTVQQVHDQSGGDCHSSEGCDEDCSSGTVLHDANLLMIFGMQMIRKTLKRGIKEFCGDDDRACECDNRPPHRLGTYCNQNDGHRYESEYLIPQTVLRAEPFYQPGGSESKSHKERLILLRAHQ